MMIGKLYDMGRFFMIADTGDDPPSLFQHNINTNLQVCAGNMTGLPEVMDTYFRFYETKFDDFRLKRQTVLCAGACWEMCIATIIQACSTSSRLSIRIIAGLRCWAGFTTNSGAIIL